MSTLSINFVLIITGQIADGPRRTKSWMSSSICGSSVQRNFFNEIFPDNVKIIFFLRQDGWRRQSYSSTTVFTVLS